MHDYNALFSGNATISNDVADGSPVLTVNNVKLSFGNVIALNGVSCELRQGELLAIIGPNGAGKTALINSISGFYQPQEGSITYKGKDLVRMSSEKIAKAGIARTFQNIALYSGLSVRQNIMSGRHFHIKENLFAQMIWFGPTVREETKHLAICESIIDFLELEPVRNAPVGSLPYGLRKRVELGRALAMEPQILLLDEPMAGMNLEEKEDMARFALDVHDLLKVPIILVEHDMGVVMDIAQRIVVLDFGEKIAEGLPKEIKENPAVMKAYLGTDQNTEGDVQ